MSFFFCNVVHVLCCFGERFAGSSHPLSKYLSSVWIYIIAIFWHLEEALDFSTSKSHNRIVLNNILNKTDTWNLYFSLQHLWKSWKLFKVWLQLLNNSLHWITVWICWVFQTDVQKYIYKNIQKCTIKGGNLRVLRICPLSGCEVLLNNGILFV